jgi:hypothetical protein
MAGVADDSTGMYDDNGALIHVGDRLRSRHGYDVIVYRHEDGDYCGKLVCDPDHSCADVPYHLDGGKGHVKQESAS